MAFIEDSKIIEDSSNTKEQYIDEDSLDSYLKNATKNEPREIKSIINKIFKMTSRQEEFVLDNESRTMHR